jgi:hypothetical protein
VCTLGSLRPVFWAMVRGLSLSAVDCWCRLLVRGLVRRGGSRADLVIFVVRVVFVALLLMCVCHGTSIRIA